MSQRLPCHDELFSLVAHRLYINLPWTHLGLMWIDVQESLKAHHGHFAIFAFGGEVHLFRSPGFEAADLTLERDANLIVNAALVCASWVSPRVPWPFMVLLKGTRKPCARVVEPLVKGPFRWVLLLRLVAAEHKVWLSSFLHHSHFHCEMRERIE